MNPDERRRAPGPGRPGAAHRARRPAHGRAGRRARRRRGSTSISPPSATSAGMLADVAARLDGDRPRARPRAGRARSASASWSPATRSGRGRLDDLAAARAGPGARRRRRSGSGCGGRCGLARAGRVRRRRRLPLGHDATAPTLAGDDRRRRWPARGQTVVSGAAFGIDQAAHRGALAVRRPDGRGAGLRRRPGLPDGAQAPARPPRRDRRGGLRAGARAARRPGIRFLARNRLIAALTARHRRGRGGACAAVRSTPPTGPGGSTGR